MRVLEIILLLAELMLIFSFRSIVLERDFRQGLKLLFLLPLVLFVPHALLEGVRWQMIPAYGIVILLSLPAVVPSFFHLHRWLKVFFVSFAVLSIIISLLLSHLLPVFHLPKPSGKFAIGTTYLHLRDSARLEPITDDPTDYRELMVRVWYPARPVKRAPFPYMHPKLSRKILESFGLPGFLFSHFDRVKTHTLQDAEVAREGGSFPGIIFSHGYLSHSTMYTCLLGSIASHGYIIFSIDYTYETPFSIFPGSDARPYDKEYTDVWKYISWEAVQAHIKAFRTTKDLEGRRKYVGQYLEQVPYTPRADDWARDIGFVIDQLNNKALRQSHPFLSSLDPGSIGAIGHSLGGAASAVACAKDYRIRAGVNLDGSQWGTLMNDTITQPFLWMTAPKDPQESSMDIDTFIYEQVTANDFYHLDVAGATHTNFSDVALWTTFPSLVQAGSIDPYRMIKITNNCILTFFDRFLKQKPVTLESQVDTFGEVTLKVRMSEEE